MLLKTQNNLGTDTLKGVLSNLIDVATIVADALRDGFQVIDLVQLVPAFTKIDAVIKTAPAAFEELKDLSPIEAKEVVEYIAVKFDIPNDRVEGAIEDALRLIVRTYGEAVLIQALYLDWKDWAGNLKK